MSDIHQKHIHIYNKPTKQPSIVLVSPRKKKKKKKKEKKAFFLQDPKGTKINQWERNVNEIEAVHVEKQWMSEYPEFGNWKLVATMRVSH